MLCTAYVRECNTAPDWTVRFIIIVSGEAMIFWLLRLQFALALEYTGNNPNISNIKRFIDISPPAF
ncbi:hypothetical protein BSPA111_25800 [Buttiauxella sp. A111]|nr:hypothetical protein BSPA111_25800 [Buttiauxella sp. A111]